MRISLPNVVIETTVLKNELESDQPAIESTIAQILTFKMLHEWTVSIGDGTCALPTTLGGKEKTRPLSGRFGQNSNILWQDISA